MEYIKSIKEYFGRGLDPVDATEIINMAGQYTSDADDAANQMWNDVNDLVGYLKSDHIPKKYHKEFDKSVESYKKRRKL